MILALQEHPIFLHLRVVASAILAAPLLYSIARLREQSRVCREAACLTMPLPTIYAVRTNQLGIWMFTYALPTPLLPAAAVPAPEQKPAHLMVRAGVLVLQMVHLAVTVIPVLLLIPVKTVPAQAVPIILSTAL